MAILGWLGAAWPAHAANLLDEQGVKPNRPSGGSTGLDSVLASDDKPAKVSGKKAKKAHRGRN